MESYISDNILVFVLTELLRYFKCYSGDTGNYHTYTFLWWVYIIDKIFCCRKILQYSLAKVFFSFLLNRFKSWFDLLFLSIFIYKTKRVKRDFLYCRWKEENGITSLLFWFLKCFCLTKATILFHMIQSRVKTYFSWYF